MSNNVDPTDAIAKMAEALGLSSSELAEVAARLGNTSTIPTVAAYLPEAIEACPTKSLATYKPHFNRIAEKFGDKRLDEVTEDDLIKCRDAIILAAGTKKVADAKKHNRALISYEIDAHGYGAGENFVRAARFFFKSAMRKRIIRDNAAQGVAVPKRRNNQRRPLTATELNEVGAVWCTTGNDPELDCLLFEFHRKTAARREGGINLRLANFDEDRAAVNLTEKFGKTRELPFDLDFIDRLRAFAQSRGAVFPSDFVFRSKAGRPITRKRYEMIYGRVDQHTRWTEPLDFGVHWIRHTTLDDVRTVADPRVAASYAGHDDESGDTINRYNKVDFEERCAAFEAIFGSRFNRG